MDRRQFLTRSAAGLGGLSLGLGAAEANARTSRPADVMVIGAGVFGVWTALMLRRRGLAVTLVDPLGPGNVRSGSGGPSRMVQTDSDTPAYIRACVEAFPQWKEAEAQSGERFLHEIGRLRLELDDKHLARAKERQQKLKAFGVLDTEIIEADDVRRRWPQIRADDVLFASFNPGGPGGSVLLASKACRAVANLFLKAGGTMVTGRARPVTARSGQLKGLKLDSGATLTAGKYVFACGWNLPELFPELLGDRIIIENRDVFYYALRPGDEQYAHPAMPAWSVPAHDVYGFPAIDGEGFKVAPFNDPRSVQNLVNKTGQFTYHRFPGLAGNPLKTIRKCWVDLTIDYDFIVDRHPGLVNVYLVGGGSGHGFKHGPVVGDDAARLVAGEARNEELATLFKLDERKFDPREKKRFDDK